MKSIWRVLAGSLALVLVGLGLLWTISYQPPQAGSASARLAGGVAQLGSSETLPFTQTVSGPYAPTPHQHRRARPTGQARPAHPGP